jgi:hypothetical protein
MDNLSGRKRVTEKYCDEFNPEFFTMNIKRWYLGTEEKGFNRKLLNLLETFWLPHQYHRRRKILT